MFKLFNQRFEKRMEEEPKWVAFLDPRIAGQMSHLKKGERKLAIGDLITAAAELSGEIAPTCQTDNAITQADNDDFMTGYLFEKKRRKSMSTPVTAKCRREVNKYLAEIDAADAEGSDDEDPIKNPFDWWRGNQHKYCYLSRLARKWLGTVATSVASERAFSNSGNIVTVRRCSLAPELVRDLVFIAENSHRIQQQQTSFTSRKKK
ncbi:hypothetical protein ON010_g7145 [Phytophthora cinnamomi]|nr:hypothetical protein ON010_g7145 [Phytophthora cinnamomi]